MGDAGGNVTMARIPFYYLPHDTLVLKADATGEAWELSGDPSILPFVLRIRSFDRAGKTLTTAERSVPTWGQSARFSLRNAPTAAEGYVFEVLKDGMTVWTRFIGLSEAIPPKTKIPPVWFFNRDKIALFFADAAPLEAGIVVKGQGIRPLMNRLLPGGLYQIYAPLESGLIRLDGEAWSQAPAYLIRLNPGTESQWAANGYKMEFSSQSVNVPRVLRIQTGIEFRHDEGYPLCSVPISLDPAHLPLLEAVRVSLHLPPQVNPGQLGFFVRRGRSWSHLGTRIDGDSTFSSRIGLLGTDLALLRDIFPPRIGSGSMARMRGKRMFLVGVGDKGKGINHTQVTVFSGERRLEVEYDPDRNRLEVDLETLRPGPHRLIVGVADYAGHRTSRTFDIRIGPDDQDKGQNTETSE
jgi:hypothetical protein